MALFFIPASRTSDPETAGSVLDARGGYVLPGLIDLHSDSIEKEWSRAGGEF